LVAAQIFLVEFAQCTLPPEVGKSLLVLFTQIGADGSFRVHELQRVWSNLPITLKVFTCSAAFSILQTVTVDAESLVSWHKLLLAVLIFSVKVFGKEQGLRIGFHQFVCFFLVQLGLVYKFVKQLTFAFVLGNAAQPEEVGIHKVLLAQVVKSNKYPIHLVVDQVSYQLVSFDWEILPLETFHGGGNVGNHVNHVDVVVAVVLLELVSQLVQRF